YPDEPLRVVVNRMAEKGVTRLPVVEHENHRKLIGMISLKDLLAARVHNLEQEERRERILPLRLIFPMRVSRAQGRDSVGSSRLADYLEAPATAAAKSPAGAAAAAEPGAARRTARRRSHHLPGAHGHLIQAVGEAHRVKHHSRRALIP